MKFRWPFHSQKRDDEMTAEMEFHLESKARELVEAGMSEADARLEARRRFGNVLKHKEAGHEIRAGRLVRRRRPRRAGTWGEACAGARAFRSPSS